MPIVFRRRKMVFLCHPISFFTAKLPVFAFPTPSTSTPLQPAVQWPFLAYRLLHPAMKTRLVCAFSCVQISRVLTLVALAAPIFALAQNVPTKPVTDTVKLSVFTVTSEKNTGYQSLQTTSGMRTVQELKNVANSISIVNSELIADIGATSLMEVSKYFVSGEASPNPNGFQQTISRGIPSNSGALRNGWYWYSPRTRMRWSASNFYAGRMPSSTANPRWAA